MASLRQANEGLSNQLAEARSSQSLAANQKRELLKLRGETARLRQQAGEAAQLQQQLAQLKASQNSRPAAAPSGGDEKVLTTDSLAFAGYATPEAALQSGMCAFTKADFKILLASLPAPSRPPSGPLQAYYWLRGRQLVGNRSDVDRIHIGPVAYQLPTPWPPRSLHLA